MNLNVKSVISLTKMCISHLVKQKGSIVNVSSLAGTKSFAGILAYCISKSALDQFTKCVALDVASRGVRVSSVNPGVIVINLQLKAGLSSEEYKQFLKDSKWAHALGRVGQPIEVAKTIAFLVSELSSFITGEIVHVDGGRHLMGPIDKTVA